MFTKIFGTANGSYATATNWQPITVRSAAWAWTLSGSGTNEYYLRTAGGANPGFVAKPGNVHLNNSNATEGTVGSLAAGTWGYGDNDTLGYSTLYVRLSDGVDPDSKAFNFVKFFQIPQTGEHVRLAAESGSITSGLDQSAVAIGDFIVEAGYDGDIGTAATTTNPAEYLKIDPDRFEYNGRGIAYIDLGAAAISPSILGTVNASNGTQGLYLKGSAIATLNIIGGVVGLASRPGETSAATTVRVMSSTAGAVLGNGCTITNLHQYGGSVLANCGITTTLLYGGTLITREDGDLGTITQYGGTFAYGSSGDITAYNIQGGTLDETQSGATRTIAALNLYRGSYKIMRNKEAVTHTAETVQESFTLSISATGGDGGFGI